MKRTENIKSVAQPQWNQTRNTKKVIEKPPNT